MIALALRLGHSTSSSESTCLSPVSSSSRLLSMCDARMLLYMQDECQALASS